MNRIKQLRLERRISQVKLAADLNTTQASVSKYELGKLSPDAELLRQLASYVDVSVDYLLELSPLRRPESPGLTEGEWKCLSVYNSLSPEQKKQALAYMTGLKET